MKSFAARLRAGAGPEDGFSLAEVLVAMMVFATISVGVAYSLLSVLALTKDSRARQVATHLAAQEIDLDRSEADVFALGNASRTVSNAAGTFHVERRTQWVTGDGADKGCGTGTGALQHKRINVTVTWDGMSTDAAPVRSDTLLAPRTRINDPALGTILVSVLTATGAGSAGVSVSAAPTPGIPGNTAVPVAGSPTDSQGCSYLLKVVPGTYDVTVSRAGYIDPQQVQTTARSSGVSVTAGGSGSAGFVFDQAALFSITYASNAGSNPVQLPTNLDTSLLSTAGVHVSPATGAAASRTFQLFPFPSGYAVMAGKYVAPSESSPGCLSVDPEAWPASAGTGAAGGRTQATTTAAANLPMGLLSVSGATSQYLTAVSAIGEGTEDPGCSVPMTYTFDPLSSAGRITLPYGSWRLYTGSSLGAKTTPVPAGSIAVAEPGSVASTGVLTLDPRTGGAP